MTREGAFKTLKENLCGLCAYGSQNMESCDIKGCDNRDAIKALEQEPKTGHWIPVSERLPEKDGDYFVAYENGYVEDYHSSPIGIERFEVDCESFGWWHEYFNGRTMASLGSEWEEITVVAWMPLPEPYKVESEDRND